jgi:hypothetical protein
MRLQHAGPFADSRTRTWCRHCMRAAATRAELDALSCAHDEQELLDGRGQAWCAACGTCLGEGDPGSPARCPRCAGAECG